jgi:hypothetical protein
MPVACTIDSYMTGAHHDFTRTLPVVTPPASVYLPLVAGGNSSYVDPNWGASTITFTPAVYDPLSSVITVTITAVNSSGATQPEIVAGCMFTGGTLLTVDPPPELVSSDQGVGWVRDFAIDAAHVFTATLDPNGRENVVVACTLDNFARHIHYELGNTLPVVRQ